MKKSPHEIAHAESSPAIEEGHWAKELLAARLVAFLSNQKKDFRPQDILEKLQSQADPPTLRQIHELLITDRRFVRTRSGRFQLNPVAGQSGWEPLGPTEWTISCLMECAKANWASSPDSLEGVILEFLLKMLDFSPTEADSLLQLIGRVGSKRVAVSAWPKLAQMLPNALGPLCLLGCVKVASTFGGLNRDAQQSLNRIAKHLQLDEAFLARLIRQHGIGIHPGATDEFDLYVALELPDRADRSHIDKQYGQLVKSYQPDDYAYLGLDYVIFVERRLRKIVETYSALLRPTEFPKEESDIPTPEPLEESVVSPDQLSVAQASEQFRIPVSFIYKACRDGVLSTSRLGDVLRLVSTSEVAAWAQNFHASRRNDAASTDLLDDAPDRVDDRRPIKHPRGERPARIGRINANRSLQTPADPLPCLRGLLGDSTWLALTEPGGHLRLDFDINPILASVDAQLQLISETIEKATPASGLLDIALLRDLWPESKGNDIHVSVNAASQLLSQFVTTRTCILLPAAAEKLKLAVRKAFLPPVEWDEVVEWMHAESGGLLNAHAAEDLVVYQWGGAILTVDDVEYLATFDDLTTVDIMLAVLTHDGEMSRAELLRKCDREYERVDKTWSEGFRHLKLDPRVQEDSGVWFVQPEP